MDTSAHMVTAAVYTFCPSQYLCCFGHFCVCDVPTLHARNYHFTAAVQCRLPRAATCFNTLYLPRYSSKAVMQQRLAQACSAQLMFDEGDSQHLLTKCLMSLCCHYSIVHVTVCLTKLSPIYSDVTMMSPCCYDVTTTAVQKFPGILCICCKLCATCSSDIAHAMQEAITAGW